MLLKLMTYCTNVGCTILKNKVIEYLRWCYRRKQHWGEPLTFRMSEGLGIFLYPEGQIVELLFTHKFERTELSQVAMYLKPGMRVLDIGANVGLYSILMGKIVGDEGVVFAFEPSSESYQRLMRNLTLNNSLNVNPEKLAVGSFVSDDVTLRRESGYKDGDRYIDKTGAEDSEYAASRIDMGDSERVKTTTLDQYFYSKKYFEMSIDFIKMDIEGGELDVFLGAEKVLKDNRDVVIMFECTSENCTRIGYQKEELFALLYNYGFEIYCWNSKRHVWKNDLNSLKLAGNIWACRDKSRLPHIGSL